MEIVDYINGTLCRMGSLIRCNHKAYLLENYYITSLRDNDISMNSEEWTRFKYRITQKWRQKFDELGTFEEIFDGKNKIYVADFLEIADKILTKNNDLMEIEFDRQLSYQTSVESMELEMELDEKANFELQRSDTCDEKTLEEDGIDVAIFRKEIQMSVKLDGVNNMFVDLIDDGHRKEIWKNVEVFSSRRIDLKKQASLWLSKDDMDVKALREELGAKPDDNCIFIGDLGKQAD